MKNHDDHNENRTSDISACRAVPQPTPPTLVPLYMIYCGKSDTHLGCPCSILVSPVSIIPPVLHILEFSFIGNAIAILAADRVTG